MPSLSSSTSESFCSTCCYFDDIRLCRSSHVIGRLLNFCVSRNIKKNGGFRLRLARFDKISCWAFSVVEAVEEDGSGGCDGGAAANAYATMPAETVFSNIVKKLQADELKPAEQITLEPYERDHACVVGGYHVPKKQKTAAAS
ncbi:hypothetical protein F2Q69_00023224 [Brassica cretica]|uniref:Uncharacterized protein n=1 Tax=Brassica cretica TaxID=69181 RepID=A0A8S9QE55_BRACR|nr:hypothetical protein F2Q69_00023224 [Brassica cretica]